MLSRRRAAGRRRRTAGPRELERRIEGLEFLMAQKIDGGLRHQLTALAPWLEERAQVVEAEAAGVPS